VHEQRKSDFRSSRKRKAISTPSALGEKRRDRGKKKRLSRPAKKKCEILLCGVAKEEAERGAQSKEKEGSVLRRREGE